MIHAKYNYNMHSKFSVTEVSSYTLCLFQQLQKMLMMKTNSMAKDLKKF